MTNSEVAQRFLRGIPGHTTTLSTDGQTIRSYGVAIARKTPDDARVEMVGAGTYYSRTTSRHRNIVRGLAQASGISIVEG